jgi:uncharacterized membrane protein (UPF0182 family)
VETIYLKANSSSMPEVKRVILYYNDRIAYESTLAEALDAMFGYGVGDESATQPGGEGVDQEGAGEDAVTPPASGGTPGGSGGSSPGAVDAGSLSDRELIAAAQAAYDKGQQAMKSGDWAAYGRAQEELGRYLEQLAGGGARPAAPIEETADAAAADSDTAAPADEAAATEG